MMTARDRRNLAATFGVAVLVMALGSLPSPVLAVIGVAAIALAMRR
jgi:hypothetical protein